MRLTKRNSSEAHDARREVQPKMAERTHAASTAEAAAVVGSATPVWKKALSIAMTLLLAMSFLNLVPTTPQAADAAGNDENQTTTLAASTDDGSYNVKINYDEGAQLPEGAYLTIDEAATDSAEYNTALSAVAKSQAGEDATDEEVAAKAESLGMDALDITLHDADGNEAEPAGDATVDVKITTSTLADEADLGTLQVNQVNNVSDGATTASTVATTDPAAGETVEGTDNPMGTVTTSEDGVTTAEFQADTLGTLGISYQPMAAPKAGTTVELAVGETTTLSGTEGNDESWVSDNESVATVDEDGKVTARAAGEAEITHTYYTSKKKKHQTEHNETWTIKVTDGGSGTVSDGDATATSTNSNPKVTVKETGSAKKISGYHVVVKDADADWSTVANCLKAYHIYLADDQGNEVSSSEFMNGKLNLRVTLTYSTLPEWFDKAKTVKHYNNSKDKSEQTINNVKFDKSAMTISFIVHGFSDFVISSNGSSSSTVTTEGGSILEGVKGNDANAWQIVSNGYAGNSVNNKVESTDGNVRVQKNVIPTGVENEFLVYLSVDKRKVETVSKTRTDEWLRTKAKYVAGSSTNLNDAVPGSVTTVHGQVKGVLDYDAEKGTHVILTYQGKVIGETYVKCAVSNPSFYLWTSTDAPNKKDKCIAIAETHGTKSATIETELTKEAYELLISAVDTQTSEETVNLESVTDTLGTGFAYEELYNDSSVNGSVTESNGTITWTITEKSNPRTETTKEDAGDGTGSTTTWYLNVAELLYKVKYTPTASAGLEISTNRPVSIDNPSAEDNTAVGEADVNSKAVLGYRMSTADEGTPDMTATFPVPEVRGMLYELKAKKVDDAGQALAGATFGLYTDATCTNPVKDVAARDVTATSDANGIVDFKNLQYGTYYMKEISAAPGYAISDSAGKGPYVTCYTTDSKKLKGQGPGEEALYAMDPCNAFMNNPIVVNVRKYAASSDVSGYDTSKPLAGAKFALYTDKECTKAYSTEVQTGSDGSASWSKLPAGTYYLKETYAPTGYQLDTKVHTVVVSDTYDANNNLITVDGATPTTPNTVTIADSPNPSLPITAGNGIAWALALGAVAAAAGAILLARSRRIAEAQNVGAHSK